ncbi:cytochrome P460 family protein, partial [Rhizobium ruizarguesonis]
MSVLNEGRLYFRGILGNDIAMKAFREGTRTFPDGTVLARLAYVYKSSP